MTEPQENALAELLLATADDTLMLGHRNSDWTGLAPILEEDIAFSSFAQDDMAHAQVMYELAGELLDKSADQLAFGRLPGAYRCAAIVEVPDEFDWATALARLFYCNHFNYLRFQRMARSSWDKLAPVASRITAEQQIALEHVDDWIVRLGAGTEEARQRVQQALDHLVPLAPMLFEPVDGQEKLETTGIYPGSEAEMFAKWSSHLMDVASRAKLALKIQPRKPSEIGGRRGKHSDVFASLLDEMCEVYRIEPDAKW